MAIRASTLAVPLRAVCAQASQCPIWAFPPGAICLCPQFQGRGDAKRQPAFLISTPPSSLTFPALFLPTRAPICSPPPTPCPHLSLPNLPSWSVCSDGGSRKTTVQWMQWAETQSPRFEYWLRNELAVGAQTRDHPSPDSRFIFPRTQGPGWSPGSLPGQPENLRFLL